MTSSKNNMGTIMFVYTFISVFLLPVFHQKSWNMAKYQLTNVSRNIQYRYLQFTFGIDVYRLYVRPGFKNSSILGPNSILLGHLNFAYFRYPWGINPSIDTGSRKTEPSQSVWVESQWTNVSVQQQATCA